MEIFGVRPNCWYKYDDDTRINLGHQKHTGVYALYDNSGLIYIGHSTNLFSRFKNHEKGFTYAKYKITLDLDTAQQSERKLIARLKPTQNKIFVPMHDTETKRFNCEIDMDVYQALKIKSSIRDIPVSLIVNDILEKKLKK